MRPVLKQGAGLTVSARLRTRRSGDDVYFGVFFGTPEDLTGAVADVFGAGVPLWHLAFLNPAMARARGLGEGFLLFGAYPAQRAAAVEGTFEGAFEARGGNMPIARGGRGSLPSPPRVPLRPRNARSSPCRSSRGASPVRAVVRRKTPCKAPSPARERCYY